MKLKKKHNFSIFEPKGKGKYLSARLELITIDNDNFFAFTWSKRSRLDGSKTEGRNEKISQRIFIFQNPFCQMVFGFKRVTKIYFD